MTPLRDEAIGNVRPALLAFGGAVALLFLIVCVNVANLSALRGASRLREVAIRSALGASRRRAGPGLLVEYALLAGAGWRLRIWLSALAVGGCARRRRSTLRARERSRWTVARSRPRWSSAFSWRSLPGSCPRCARLLNGELPPGGSAFAPGAPPAATPASDRC